MKDIRKLTGNWHLEPIYKSRFFTVKKIGYEVMVEVETSYWDDPTYGNGGGNYSPRRLEYQNATQEDLEELEIKLKIRL